MRLVAQSVPGQFRRGPLVALGFFFFVVVAGYQASQFILSGDTLGLILTTIFFIFVAVVVVMLNDWRRGLYFFLLWLLFEDFARKFLGNNMSVYFAKDFLAIVVYLSFFAAYRRKDRDIQSFRPPFRAALLVLFWFGVMQAFSPASTSM